MKRRKSLTASWRKCSPRRKRLSFDEHEFFREELKENFNVAFSWDSHEAQFRKIKDEISRGAELLREVEARQREADDLLKKREKQLRETDAAQRRERRAGVRYGAGGERVERSAVQLEREEYGTEVYPGTDAGNGSVCR